MFHGYRWAAAFVTVLDRNAEEGLVRLKALVPPLKALAGFSGYSAARRLEQLLREIITVDDTWEYAIRFIALVVEKDQFKNIGLILHEIEEYINVHKGVLGVIVETASPPDGDFEQYLARMVQERTGASGVNIQIRIKPELLGGCRLQIGGFYIDASLKGQIAKMKADLEAEIFNE